MGEELKPLLIGYGGGWADDGLKGLEEELVPGSGGYKGAVDLGGIKRVAGALATILIRLFMAFLSCWHGLSLRKGIRISPGRGSRPSGFPVY